MSKNVKAVVSAVVMLAVGMTVGATATQLFNSMSAKKDLKKDIEVAQEYSNLMYSLAEVYYQQADYIDKADLSQLRRENGDLLRNGADNVSELTHIAEEISSKIFVTEKDRKNIVELEMTIENADFNYWKNTVESEKKELEQMKTGVQ